MGRILKIQQGTGFLFENGKKVGEAYLKDADLPNIGKGNVVGVMWVRFYDKNYDFQLNEENRIELMPEDDKITIEWKEKVY